MRNRHCGRSWFFVDDNNTREGLEAWRNFVRPEEFLQRRFVGLAGDSQPMRSLKCGEGRHCAPAHLTIDAPGIETAFRKPLLDFGDTWR